MNNEMTVKQMLEAAGPVSRFVSAQTAELIIGLATAVCLLTEQRDAVVAEMSQLWGFCKNAAFDADYEAELGMERGGFTDALEGIRTPATDAAITALRAEGVEMFADFCSTANNGHEVHPDIDEMRLFALQLRECKGAQE